MKKISKSKKKEVKKEEDVDEKVKNKTGKKGRPVGAKNKKNNQR